MLRNIWLIIVTFAVVTVGLFCSGCSSTTGPSATPTSHGVPRFYEVSPAGELCVLATRYVDGVYIDYGVLVPVSVWVTYPPTVPVKPLSYCNTAE